MKFIEHNNFYTNLYCPKCGRWRSTRGYGEQARDKRGRFTGFFPQTITCKICKFQLNLGELLLYGYTKEEMEGHIRAAYRQHMMDGGTP